MRDWQVSIFVTVAKSSTVGKDFLISSHLILTTISRDKDDRQDPQFVDEETVSGRRRGLPKH